MEHEASEIFPAIPAFTIVVGLGTDEVSGAEKMADGRLAPIA